MFILCNVMNHGSVYFGPRVYPRGSYVITHVRPSVRGPSLNISETTLRIFLILDLVYPKGSYVITYVSGPSVVRGPSVFKYLRDRSKDFSNFLHEVSAP